MSIDGNSSEPSPWPKGQFATTHWSVVLRAGRFSDAAESRAAEALAELCRIYWYPLYAYVRRRGCEAHDAEDLTQEFFLRLLSKNDLAAVDRAKGKFRSFLLAAMKHFLANQWDRACAQKRGGKKGTNPDPPSADALRDSPKDTLHQGSQPLFSLDALAAETRYRLEPVCDVTPEKLFERQWALAVLEQVLARLEAECVALDGGSARFAVLKQYLTGGGSSGGYAESAAALGLSVGAVKTAVHRLRRRYRLLLREEIAQTVADPEAVDDEIRYLLSCL